MIKALKQSTHSKGVTHAFGGGENGESAQYHSNNRHDALPGACSASDLGGFCASGLRNPRCGIRNP